MVEPFLHSNNITNNLLKLVFSTNDIFIVDEHNINYNNTFFIVFINHVKINNSNQILQIIQGNFLNTPIFYLLFIT